MIFYTYSYRGHVVKHCRISTNEPDSIKYVSITSDVVTDSDSTYPIVINPNIFDISQDGNEIRDTLSFEITNLSAQSVEIDEIVIPRDLMELDFNKHIDAGETIQGVVRLKEAALEEEFEKTITIEVEGDEHIRFSIPVFR